MKALVVDDSAVMRRVLIGNLSQLGISEVGEAGDGKEAVEKTLGEEFGLVLMDWNLPNMTGIDAVKEIRAKGKKVPIIMVTTEAEKARVLEALKAGANSYIIKPFEVDAFVTKVKETLGQS